MTTVSMRLIDNLLEVKIATRIIVWFLEGGNKGAKSQGSEGGAHCQCLCGTVTENVDDDI